MGMDMAHAPYMGDYTLSALCDGSTPIARPAMPMCEQLVCASVIKQMELVQATSSDTDLHPSSTFVHALTIRQNTHTVRPVVPVPNSLRSAALPLRI